MLSAATSLDSEETTVSPAPADTYQRHLKSLDPEEYHATYQLYSDLKYAESRNYLEKFSRCRTTSFFIRNTRTGKVRVRTNACRLRWCPLCGRNKSKSQAIATREWAQKAQNLKLLTLTLRHSRAGLSHQIKHLYKSFQAFRKHPKIAKTFIGAVWFFQIKTSTSDNLWHPHIHAVIDSPYISQHLLSRIWLKITKTSTIVDIRAVYDFRIALKYIARYAARPTQLKTLTRPQRTELFTALHGRRMAGTWGSAHAISLSPKAEKDVKGWEPLGSWESIKDTHGTSPIAREIWRAYTAGVPYHGPALQPHLAKLWEGVGSYVPYGDSDP